MTDFNTLDTDTQERLFSGNSRGFQAVESKMNDGFLTEVQAFQSAGFRLANKTRLQDSLNSDRPFDPFRPDVALVSTGGVAGAPLENAMVFLHAAGRGNAFVHTALSPNTTPQQMDALGKMGGFFFEEPDGTLTGYIPVRAENDVPGIEVYQKFFNDIAELNLETVKMPFTNNGMCFLPFFGKEGAYPQDLNDAQKAGVLGHYLQEYSDAVEIPDNVMHHALNQQEGFRVDAPAPDAETQRHNRPAPGRRH